MISATADIGLRMLQAEQLRLVVKAVFREAGAQVDSFDDSDLIVLRSIPPGKSEKQSIGIACVPRMVGRGVGPDQVRMLMQEVAKHGFNSGMLVSPGHITEEARVYASKTNIQLVDGVDLWNGLERLSPECREKLLDEISNTRSSNLPVAVPSNSQPGAVSGIQQTTKPKNPVSIGSTDSGTASSSPETKRKKAGSRMRRIIGLSPLGLGVIFGLMTAVGVIFAKRFFVPEPEGWAQTRDLQRVKAEERISDLLAERTTRDPSDLPTEIRELRRILREEVSVLWELAFREYHRQIAASVVVQQCHEARSKGVDLLADAHGKLAPLLARLAEGVELPDGTVLKYDPARFNIEPDEVLRYLLVKEHVVFAPRMFDELELQLKRRPEFQQQIVELTWEDALRALEQLEAVRWTSDAAANARALAVLYNRAMERGGDPREEFGEDVEKVVAGLVEWNQANNAHDVLATEFLNLSAREQKMASLFLQLGPDGLVYDEESPNLDVSDYIVRTKMEDEIQGLRKAIIRAENLATEAQIRLLLEIYAFDSGFYGETVVVAK